MIIECKKCGTKYRFDETLIVGEGIRVRCSRCSEVFFHENPSRESVIPPIDIIEEGEAPEVDIPKETPEDEIVKEIPDFDDFTGEKEPFDTEEEIVERVPDFDDFPAEKKPVDTDEKIVEEVEDFDDSAEEKEPVDTEEEGDKEKEKTKRHLWTPGKVIAYIVILALVLGGVYMSLLPQTGKQVLDSLSRLMSTETDNLEKKDTAVAVKAGSVNFKDVKERLIKNFILGDLLVIQGTVINKYEHPISKVRVRGKLLNAAKKDLDEVASYCGNLLTDEELGHLTAKEIAEELSIQIGSDISNDNIAPEGEIPFMLVFTNPPKEAVEFIVELAKD